MTPAHCFTYGSLMVEAIMSRVCGFPCRGEDAALADFSRHPVRGEDYPGIRPARGAEVAGRLYRDLAPAAWTRLDDFEGAQYLRATVAVRLPDGRIEAAWTYVFRPEFHALLLPGAWDAAEFLRTGRHRFEQRYLGFERLPDDQQ